MTRIPVDEALPTKKPDWINVRSEECWFHIIKRVQVTDTEDNVIIAGYSLRNEVFYGDNSIYQIKVKAWMPLPEKNIYMGTERRERLESNGRRMVRILLQVLQT